MHALIVEDDPWIAMAIEDNLADLGYATCDLATCYDEAAGMVRCQRPDLIITEASIDRICGVAAIGSMCMDGSIPVVFVTAEACKVQQFSPSHQIVRKPFSSTDLKTGVSEAVASVR